MENARNKKKFEQYKRLVRFVAGAAVVLCVTFIFIVFWKENYNEGIVFPFYYISIE